jgi:predicted RNase H-like nuclease (RuvC/YqgF family)
MKLLFVKNVGKLKNVYLQDINTQVKNIAKYLIKNMFKGGIQMGKPKKSYKEVIEEQEERIKNLEETNKTLSKRVNELHERKEYYKQGCILLQNKLKKLS